MLYLRIKVKIRTKIKTVSAGKDNKMELSSFYFQLIFLKILIVLRIVDDVCAGVEGDAKLDALRFRPPLTRQPHLWAVLVAGITLHATGNNDVVV